MSGMPQEQEIEHLKAENLASTIENGDLVEAARGNQIEIGTLKASNVSLEVVIAELQRAQNQIELLNRDQQARNKALEALNKELGAFSYAMPHDLRSPLRSIHGFSEALRLSAATKLTAEETDGYRRSPMPPPGWTA